MGSWEALSLFGRRDFNMLKFDRTGLTSSLVLCPESAQLAFGACATSRLLPGYLQFCAETGHGDSKDMRGALECVWNSVLLGRFAETELRRWHDVAFALTKLPEADDSEFFVCAENAAAALTFCLRFAMNQDPEGIVRAAHRAYDAAYQHAVSQTVEGLQIATGENLAQWLSHRLVQDELIRQRRDLHEIQVATAATLDLVIAHLRDRSAAETVLPVKIDQISGSH